MEDDPSIREFVLIVLVGEGYDVLAEPDGEVALDFAAEHPPDVILLDSITPVWER